MCVCGGTVNLGKYKKEIVLLRLALYATSSVPTIHIERTLVLPLFYLSFPREPCGTHSLHPHPFCESKKEGKGPQLMGEI